jgi:FkbM family methyltransferase
VEEYRLQYPLDRTSIVFDVGGFRGDYTDWCRKKWNCRVVTFEPLVSFHADIKARFANDSNVTVLNHGLGARTETLRMSVRGDSSSAYVKEDDVAWETVHLVDVVECFAAVPAIDLMKINIEGGEFELLPRMLDAGLANRVRFFQVQWHHSVGAGPRGAGGDVCAHLVAERNAIRARLSETHREEWCVNDGQWESWARK